MPETPKLLTFAPLGTAVESLPRYIGTIRFAVIFAPPESGIKAARNFGPTEALPQAMLRGCIAGVV
ncbi:hypothetical protein [Sphingomonas sp. 35-24ZXX]|uniref:hypothetical protein n=1 Tax=Sphingomonas sp. 35-24ZXX TaxID=1545915 RepID=UPI0018CD1BA6|nr:hypothetical protein [Sphingomonas sp. 35-24ZXX]